MEHVFIKVNCYKIQVDVVNIMDHIWRHTAGRNVLRWFIGHHHLRRLLEIIQFGKSPLQLQDWCGIKNRVGFQYFDVKKYVYDSMRFRGVFDEGRVRDNVLLVYGWHGLQSSSSMFRIVSFVFQ
ncbi:hypothetical protein ORF19 [Aviadenovirus bubonis]|nr:hypothetical protein ORF19 [Owl adenovirus]